MKIGIVQGSTRVHSNTTGLTTWILSQLRPRHPDLEFEAVNLATSPGHPLPLIIEEIVPQGHPLSTLPDAYADPQIRAWSKKVLEFDGIIIVTPQYNRGIPAPLKNCFDQLFWEWVNKPVLLVCLGGHGGTKVEARLRETLGSGMDAKVCEKAVNVDLPRPYIATEKRIKGTGDEEDEEWLKVNEESLETGFEQLLELMNVKE